MERPDLSPARTSRTFSSNSAAFWLRGCDMADKFAKFARFNYSRTITPGGSNRNHNPPMLFSGSVPDQTWLLCVCIFWYPVQEYVVISLCHRVRTIEWGAWLIIVVGFGFILGSAVKQPVTNYVLFWVHGGAWFASVWAVDLAFHPENVSIYCNLAK